MNVISKEFILENLLDKKGNLNFQKAKKYNLTIRSAYDILHDINEPPRCQNEKCSNLVKFQSFKNGYSRFCCTKCLNTSEFMIERIKNSHKINKEIRQGKRLETLKKKYGDDYQEKITSKVLSTKIAKYGTASYNNSEKSKQTRIDNNGSYWTENMFLKSKNTNLEKYGVEFSFQNKEVQEKYKQTMIEKYDVDNPSKNIELKKIQADNRYKTCYPHISDEMKEKLKQEILGDFVLSELIEKYKASESYIRGFIYTIRGNVFKLNSSSNENEIYKFLFRLDNKTIQNDRKVLNGLEIDILLNDIGIEYNGSYWHSDIFKDRNYHQNKKLKGLDKNVNILNIFEHDYNIKKDLWKSVIKNKLGLSDKIYGRKTDIRKVSYLESKTFLDNNHLQGSCKSSINIGLYYQNELVSLMTFGKARFSEKYEYELLRFCNKTNLSVIGGASKLLTYFEKTYNPKSLVSYANLNWSDGNLYEKLKFNFSHISKPSYVYVKGTKILTRQQCMKHKLSTLLEDFNLELTESENMKNHGFLKIYDCGNKVYYKEFNEENTNTNNR